MADPTPRALAFQIRTPYDSALVTWGTHKDAQVRRLADAMLGRRLTQEERDELKLLCAEMLDAQQELKPIEVRSLRTRVRARVALQCAVVAGGSTAIGSTCDLGLGGLGVWVDRPLPAGEPARVRLRAPGQSGELEFEVRTKWIMPEAGGWRLGLRYHQVDWPMRGLLTRMVLEAASDELLEDEVTPTTGNA